VALNGIRYLGSGSLLRLADGRYGMACSSAAAIATTTLTHSTRYPPDDSLGECEVAAF
jgi:hypothetical protein